MHTKFRETNNGSTGVNPREVAEFFSANGYAIVRGMFSTVEISEIERQLSTFIADVVPCLEPGQVYFEDVPGKPIKSIFNLENADFFKRLSEDSRLLALMRSIWPDVEVMPQSVMYFAKAANSGSRAPAHQDNAFQNLHPPEELICTIAIDESTSANGALTVQKWSHRKGRLPHKVSGVMGFSQTLISPLDISEYPEVELCMRPGDICLHHTNTVHYSGSNNTDNSRRQLGISYRTTRAKVDEEAWGQYQADLKSLHAKHSQAT